MSTQSAPAPCRRITVPDGGWVDGPTALGWDAEWWALRSGDRLRSLSGRCSSTPLSMLLKARLHPKINPIINFSVGACVTGAYCTTQWIIEPANHGISAAIEAQPERHETKTLMLLSDGSVSGAWSSRFLLNICTIMCDGAPFSRVGSQLSRTSSCTQAYVAYLE